MFDSIWYSSFTLTNENWIFETEITIGRKIQDYQIKAKEEIDEELDYENSDLLSGSLSLEEAKDYLRKVEKRPEKTQQYITNAMENLNLSI